MPVNISIKNAPGEVVNRLREREAKNHRSLQGELMAIIEDASKPNQFLTASQLLAEVRRLGLHTQDDSTAIIRAGRDRDNHR